MGLADYIGMYWAGAEVLYGTIIAMTFTSALREVPDFLDVAVTNIVWAALFCCIAWGIADGLFYVWERSYLVRQENRVIESSRSVSGRGTAVALLGEQLDDSVLRNLVPERRAAINDLVSRELADAAGRERVAPREAGTILLGTFLRSSVAGLVIVAPFFLVDDVDAALYALNTLGILLLFAVGYARSLDPGIAARAVGGLGAAMVGVVIAAITIALGG